MLHTIENEHIRAVFSTLGAELQSLVLKEAEIEYIWQNNTKIWPWHAPVLFPFIGRLKDGEYSLENKVYKAAFHGFGRDSEFDVIYETNTEIIFLLRPNELSKTMYPFKFELQICYRIIGNTLIKEHIFYNKDNKALYYEIGGHDGYNVCLEQNESMQDYYLDFGDLEAIYPLKLNDNILILEDTYRIPLHDGKLSLNMELFRNNALILHDCPVHTISLKSRKSQREIKFEFESFNNIGIWTTYQNFDSNFICFEPWSTLPDCEYLGKEIEKKVDIRKVEAGKTDILSFAVTIK